MLPTVGTIDDRGKMLRGERSPKSQPASCDTTTIPSRSSTAGDASVVYETPQVRDVRATTTFARRKAASKTDAPRSSGWSCSRSRLGCLVSSKWYGVMGFGVSFIVLIAVVLQRYFLRLRPALWGNPRGYPTRRRAR